jgi:hypothetical protein
MRSGERLSLLAMCAAAAVASAAAVFAVDHYATIEIASDREDPVAQEPAPIARRAERLPVPPQVYSEPEADARVANLPADDGSVRDTLPEEGTLLAALPTDQLLRAELTPAVETVARETPEWWSAEIRRAVPALKPALPLTKAVPPRLPWQMQALGPRSQDKRLIARLAEISPAAEKRIAEKFIAAQASWRPVDLGLVAIKDEKVLELHARAAGGAWTFIHRYPVLAASGTAGPKLRQGDHQVPEGVYGISFLNPDSRYHVSLRVNYPNTFDRQMAEKEGRTNLGGDIMIHGKNVSIGCLAIGDEAAEELFVLAARIGMSNIKLIIAPTDFRRQGIPATAAGQPAWLPNLYTEVASSMAEFTPPPSNSLLSFFGK